MLSPVPFFGSMGKELDKAAADQLDRIAKQESDDDATLPYGEVRNEDDENSADNNDKEVSKELIAITAFEKPPLSYTQLITMAIVEHPDGQVTLQEIYAYLMNKFECFRGSYTGWCNSIRHFLSRKSCFMKVPKDKKGKGHKWTMDLGCDELRDRSPGKAMKIFRRRRPSPSPYQVESKNRAIPSASAPQMSLPNTCIFPPIDYPQPHPFFYDQAIMAHLSASSSSSGLIYPLQLSYSNCSQQFNGWCVAPTGEMHREYMPNMY